MKPNETNKEKSYWLCSHRWSHCSLNVDGNAAAAHPTERRQKDVHRSVGVNVTMTYRKKSSYKNDTQTNIIAILTTDVSHIVFYPDMTLWFVLRASAMALKKKRTTSPSSSVSGGDFEDSQPSLLVSSAGRKRRRISSIPTVDPVKWPPHF